jgi:large subunit ribosomal protein L9
VKVVSEAQDLGKMMGAVTVTIAQKAGENDHLFGSVTTADIAAALEKQGYTIDRKKIQLDEPIKMLGEYKVAVRLHKDVTIEVPVHVVKED